jgi:hypothetical protein
MGYGGGKGGAQWGNNGGAGAGKGGNNGGAILAQGAQIAAPGHVGGHGNENFIMKYCLLGLRIYRHYITLNVSLVIFSLDQVLLIL